MPRSTQ